MADTRSTRRNDVDGLRVLATYLLFVFHAGKVFDPAPFFHIRNDELSFVVMVLCGFISLWHMPLFFVLAGWSVVGSLAARGGSGFLRERLLRLGVPLVVGCVLFGPVMKYVELASGIEVNHRGIRVSPDLQPGFRQVIPSGLDEAPPFTESFGEFLPTFFTSLDRFTWGHLWFIAYLLTFTLLLLPILVRIVRWRGEPAEVPAAWVYAPIVPLALAQVFLRPHWPGIQNLYDDWANVAYYTTFFLCGVAIGRFPAVERRVDGEWRRALVVACATTLGLLLAVLGVVESPSFVLAGSAVAGWCFVVGFLGLAHELVTRRTPALEYLAESAFPVYVLHQVAIILVGWFLVLPLRLGVWPKFALLVGGSLVATLAVYHLGVRPFRVPRLLLGMKRRTCPVRAATVGLVAGAAD
jgi:surface polysaccharide O-acyltransferase-like enzyme